MNTRDLGRLYVTRVPYGDTSSPWVERGWSAETDYPFRMGKCLALRIPRTTHGFALGFWGPPGDEVETLSKAAGVRLLGPAIIEMEYEDVP